MPYGVVVPKTNDDIKAAISFCKDQGMALLPRGGGHPNAGKPSIMRWYSITQNI